MQIASIEGVANIYIHNSNFKCNVDSFECKDDYITRSIKKYIEDNANDVKHTIFYITETSTPNESLIGYMSCRIISLQSGLSSCNKEKCDTKNCIPFLEVMVLARDLSHENEYGLTLMELAEEYIKYINKNYCTELNTIVLEPINDVVKQKFYLDKVSFSDNFLESIEVVDSDKSELDNFEKYIFKTIQLDSQSFFDDIDIDAKVEALLDIINFPCGKAC